VANCPHCQGEIAKLSGFISQDDHTARLAAKDAKVREAEARVAELAPKAEAYDATSTELARVKGEVAAAREDVALAGRGFTDPKVLRSLRALHAVEMADTPEADRVPLVDYLASPAAQAHPVIGGLLPRAAPPAAPAAPAQPPAPAAAAPAAPPPPAAPPAPVVPPPQVGAGVVQTEPAQQGRMTPDQIRAHLRSPSFLALKPDQQRAEMARLRAEVGRPAGS
jgi:hypothetical protein